MAFVIVHGIGWSFGILIQPVKPGPLKSQNQFNHTNNVGAAESRLPSLLSFMWRWLLKALKKLSKGFLLLPSDPPIPYYLPTN